MSDTNFIDLSDHNEFDELISKMEQSGEAKRLQDKFKKRSYRDRNRVKYYLAIAVAVICQVGSVVTASTFVFSFFLTHLIAFYYGYQIALACTAIILIVVEIFNALFHIEFWERFFLHRKLKKQVIKPLVALLLVGLISNYWSYSGGFELPKKVQAKPIPETPLPPNIESIRNNYANLADNARGDAEDYFKARSYMNKLRPSEGAEYASMKNRAGELEVEMNEKINSANQKHSSDIENAKKTYEANLMLWESSTDNNGTGLAYIAIILWLIMAPCYRFKEKYEYTIAQEYNAAKASQGPEHNTPGIPIHNAPHTQVNGTKIPPTQNTGNPIHNSSRLVVEGFVSTPNTKPQNAPIPLEKPIFTQKTQSEYTKDEHLSVYATQNSQKGVIQKGKRTVVHHAGIDRKRNPKDCFYTQNEIKNKIKEYTNRVRGAETKYNSDPSNRNKTTLENNNTWVNYWESRLPEFEGITA